MKRRLLYIGLLVVMVAAVGTVLVIRPTHAARADNKAHGSEVKIDTFSFGPEMITVSANTTVTWVNKDDVPHVIASNDGLFKSKALDTDDNYSYTFAKAGTYGYFCAIHPKMVGKIVVQ